ncbi:MAG: cytochrome c oxidase subunit II transmembrane domain-containing protein, partial [Geminicoccaceae bacterium]
MRVLGPCLLAAALAIVLVAAPALAAQPQPWELGFQPPATPVMERIEALHHLLLWIITFICIFVLALLGYACFRFRAHRHPTPSRRTHNTVLEIAWTAVPVLILVVIAIPSFKLLYYMDRTGNPEMTLKAIGHQWYWSYEYPDNGNFTFDAYMVADQDLKPGQLRLLTSDNQVVLPVDTNI